MSTITVTPIATYRTEDKYPFCPGCGHSIILDRLNEAMIRLEMDPARVVLVSDIGCVGLSDSEYVRVTGVGCSGMARRKVRNWPGMKGGSGSPSCGFK